MNYQELNFAIDECKQNLKKTDYQAIKHSEGLISEEEYKPIKEEREEWRRQINEYEALLPKAKEEWDSEISKYEEEPVDTERLFKNENLYEELYEEDGETDI